MALTLADLDIVCCYDPARSRESEYKQNARNAIMTTGCDSEYNVYVLRYWAMRASLDMIYEELWQHVELFRPRVIGIEDVAVQIAIGDAFRQLSRLQGKRIPPIDSLRPDTRVNKRYRIKTQIQRVAPYGQLFILQDSWELEAEWASFPNGRTVDILDVLAYCIQQHAIPDSQSSTDYNRKMRERREASNGHGVINIDERRYAVPGPPKDATILRYG